MSAASTEGVWIGLFGVIGPPDLPELDGCPGAYVTVLSMACDKQSFLSRVWIDAEALGLAVQEVVWCEPLETRLERYDIEDYLRQLAEEVRAHDETRFGVFHAWEREK